MRAIIFLVLPITLLAATYSNSEMLCLVNKQRVKYGLSPLGLSADLTNSAQEHSDDQAYMNDMSHNGSDGSDPGTRIQDYGYKWQACAENVAFGYPGNEKKVMKAWMQSPGHRANILGPYTHFGSAVAYSGSTPYYTQDFGSNNDPGNFPECPDDSSSDDDSSSEDSTQSSNMFQGGLHWRNVGGGGGGRRHQQNVISTPMVTVSVGGGRRNGRRHGRH